jgi:hypothetical protein
MDQEYGRIVMISTALHDPEHWINQYKFPTEEEKVLFSQAETLATSPADEEGKHVARMRGMLLARYCW